MNIDMSNYGSATTVGEIFASEPKIKTELQLGNLTIYITKELNWFQCKMYKWCFGFDVNKIEEN